MRRAAVVALAALVLLAATAASAVAATGGAGPTPAGGDRSAALADDSVTRQVNGSTNDTAVRHVDPDDTEAVDYGRIEGWLSVALTGRLGESAGELDRGDYERARALLGDDVDRYLAQYADVAGETSGTADDRLAVAFEGAATNQRAFADGVDRFERTAAEYREARRAGDEDRARRLARDLIDRAAEVDRTGQALTANYSAIENGTDADLSEETAVVRNVSANVTATGDAAAAETFLETTVTVESSPRSAAFDDPLLATGRVTAENGTPVADGHVRLVVGGQTLATGRTGGDGSFSLSGRPVLVEAGTRTASVEYVPAAEAAYLGSADSVTVRVDAVEPTLDLAVTPTSARFGDRLRAAGRVTVDGEGVPGVPVVVTLGGAEPVRLETGADGDFAGDLDVPAGVAPGDRSLSARLPTEGLAVGPAETARPVEIVASGTALTLSVERTGPDAARVSGTLAADSGRAVPGQSVVMAVDGERVGTATTDGEGRFAVEVPAPTADAATVDASFDGADTNLRDSAASATIPAADAAGAADGGPSLTTSPTVLAVAGLGLLLLAAAGYVALRWRRRAGGDAEDGTPAPTAVADESTATAGLVERARGLLAEGRPDLAVRVAYGAARERLGGEGAAASTHWEFYRSRADDLPEDADAALRSLTEAFERATFAPTGTDRETASRAVDAAGRLVEGR